MTDSIETQAKMIFSAKFHNMLNFKGAYSLKYLMVFSTRNWGINYSALKMRAQQNSGLSDCYLGLEIEPQVKCEISSKPSETAGWTVGRATFKRGGDRT